MVNKLSVVDNQIPKYKCTSDGTNIQHKQKSSHRQCSHLRDSSGSLALANQT